MIKNVTDVLVVGAGPTGLFLALLLTKLGVRVRIVDAADAPGTTSRALAVQARTLELYAQVDLADEVVRRGVILKGVNLWRRGEHAARIALGAVGEGRSRYPFGVIFPQDEHEKFLVAQLEALGTRVERGTKVTAIEETPSGIVAREQRADGTEASCEASYVAGCDGARSIVRQAIGATFPGGTYEHLFYVADIEASGKSELMNHELHVFLDDAGFFALFPLAGEGRARLVGTVREDAVAGKGTLTWEDVDRRPIDRLGLKIDRVNWFSTYHVHHRVADRFRRGRTFLLGDAAHIHSPVGGQGMNTGLGDAMNLGWKLAAALGGRAKENVLDTYEPERIAFARKLVATTDRVFKAASSDSRIAEVVRTQMIPRILPRLSRTKLGQRLLFSAVSQTGIEYRAGPWSTGRAGAVHGGDRLPWVQPGEAGAVDNFTPLRALDWQVHVYGAPPEDLRSTCEERKLGVHVFPFDARTKAADLRDDAVYVVRPDGYIGGVFTGPSATAAVTEYLDAHGIRGR